MIFINELERLTNIEHLRLIAGAEGLSRTFTTAVLFEYDPSRVLLPDFYEGDLVLTTLAYARGEPELVDQSLIALLRQNVAGILIKTAYFSELSHEVLALADQMSTPIFLFDNTYIEQVLLQITDLIRGNSRFRGYEKDIHMLMNGNLSHSKVREMLKNMNALQLETYEIIGIHPDGPMSEYETAALTAFNRHYGIEKAYMFMEADRMILILHDLSIEGEAAGTEGVRQLSERLSLPDSVHSSYGIGVSSRMTDPYQIGSALWEATIAAKVSEYRSNTVVLSEALGMDAYLFPMLQNSFLVHRCRQDWEHLNAYDRDNHASLTETAETYIAMDMSVSETAEAMYQHTNTIRYRLKKIRTLIGCESDVMFHAMLFMIVRIKTLIDSEGI